MLLSQTRRAAALLLLSLMLAPAVARADAASDARKAIQANYDKENAATIRKDLKGALAYYTPDYQHVSARGKKRTLADVRQQLPQMFQMMKSAKAKSVIQKIKLSGKEAKVTVKEHAEITLQGPQPAQTAKMVIDQVMEDTWVKGGKGWLRRHSKAISEKGTLNGQPIPQGNE